MMVDVLRPRRRMEFNAIDLLSTICVLYTERASLSRTHAYTIIDSSSYRTRNLLSPGHRHQVSIPDAFGFSQSVFKGV